MTLSITDLLTAWLTFRPIRRIRQARRARKGLPPLPPNEELMVDTKLRTSTNTGLAFVGAKLLCELVNNLAPGLLGSDAEFWIAGGFAVLVARFSKPNPDKKI